jgi:hypothetical protein
VKALRTFARLYVDDVDRALPVLRELTGEEAGLRFPYAGVEVAAIGGFLLVGGSEEALAPFRNVQTTVIVDDLGGLDALVAERGGEVLSGPNDVPTGRNATVAHPGGVVIEYVEFARAG